MILSEKETVRGVECITILAYEIKKGKLFQIEPLLELAAPTTLKELKQVQGYLRSRPGG